ncbi:MAG: arginine--tRNA ligase [Thermodesulfobacteriales bacterium]|jgi:arginyl-tRNA synthetase|nr:MAG: arginine--tRNA ligase [Thermodesulfobacteriales bacterium]
MKEDIINVVSQSVEKIGKNLDLTDLSVEIEVGMPKRKEFGDFSVNTAMLIANKIGKKPREVAELIIENLPQEKDELFNKVEIAGPGFINFYVKEEAIVNKLLQIENAGEKFGTSNLGNGEKVLVEFVSANPTGFLHMGHSRNAVVGDTVARILSASGYDVTKEFYINDAGRQMNLLGESVLIRYKELFGHSEELPEDGYKGEYVKDIASQIKAEKGDSLLQDSAEQASTYCRELAKGILLEEIKKDLADINVLFDEWYSEVENIHTVSAESEDTKLSQIKALLNSKGVLEEREGALWFKATEFGDTQDWVLIKSDGSPTYFLADIAYHLDKYERGFDRIINVWGADHHGHVSRLKAALRSIGLDDSRFNVLLIQFVRLMREGKEVAMSKRAGSYVTLKEVAQEVGADVMRFFLLMRSSESHLDFDLDLAKKESSENPVYYIQYAYARIGSIFRKAQEEGITQSSNNLALLKAPEEIDLVKKLLLFPEVLEDSAKSLAPHKVAYYLQELAAQFHVYYNKCRVVDENKDISSARLYLITCAQTVLGNGLKLLGVSAPERM